MDSSPAPQHACSPPHHILGYTIHSRTRIYVSYVIPNILELLVYIVQITADCAVSYQHFKSHQSDFGWGTLCLILVPPVVCFILILCSANQWKKPTRDGTRVKFVCMQIGQMILFPGFVIYRFAKRVFWSIEALYHDADDKERMLCLERADECSTCELYRLVQAYGQSAPQIILQLFHMLTQDLFRNFQTTTVQAISLVFSAIDLALITTTYQRFESQKQVGRHYPWSTPAQKQQGAGKVEKHQSLQEECLRKKRESERSLTKFPESDKIMENFKARIQLDPSETAKHKNDAINLENSTTPPMTHTVQVHGCDELDNEAGGGEQMVTEQTALLQTDFNKTDDDKIKTTSSLRTRPIEAAPSFHLQPIKLTPTNTKSIETTPSFHLRPIQPNPSDTISVLEECNEVPDTPPPPLPPKVIHFNMDTLDGPQLRTHTSNQGSNDTNKRRSRTFSQLETFKDMLVINAQLYIKENVPRPPKMWINRVDDSDKSATTPPQSPMTPKDVVDFFLPRPTKVVNGIPQDDFAAKTIAFFGWIAFIVMRMLSLSTFCVFFPKAFLIIMAIHYIVMLAALYLESRFKGRLNRTLFYLLLAYVYIFVLLEFRIKFKHIRVWFVGYFLITMSENLTMTMIWYAREEFESWWFGFIFEGIIYSGILFVATVLVYYCILKPKDVLLLVEEETEMPTGNQQQSITN